MIGLIFLAFVALCVVGFFLPNQQILDTSMTIDADQDEVFEVISDLRSYPEWSGIGLSDSEWVFGGPENGTGQTAAWQSGKTFGSLEILQSTQGEFVLVRTFGPLGEQRVTLVLDETEDATLMLIEAQRDLGGFPYIGRVAAMRQRPGTKAALTRAASGMSELFKP